MKIFKFIYYGIYMIGVGLKGLKFKHIYKKSGEDAAFKYGEDVFLKWSKFTEKMIGMDIEVKGKENIPKDEACVFIGNHQSILDIPALRIAAEKPVCFIAKQELLKVPVLGFWIKNMYCIPLDRSNPRNAIKVINEGVSYLKRGYSMAIFPEGTRSKDGNIAEFKKGSLKLATKAKVKIIPFSIDGTGKCYEEKKKFLPGKVTVVFGKAIDTNNLSVEESKNLNEVVRNTVIKNRILV